MAKSQIDAVGRGQVWLGQQAIERHLIDHLGGLREALQAARDAAHLPDDAPIEELPRENRSLLQWALDSVGVSADERVSAAVAQLPPAIANIARALAPLAIYRDDEPLARMDYVDIGGD